MFVVYVVHNESRNKIYIGYSADLEKRLKRHGGILASKVSSFTAKNSGKWLLVYSENFATRSDAIKREKELKSFRGREFIKKMVQ